MTDDARPKIDSQVFYLSVLAPYATCHSPWRDTERDEVLRVRFLQRASQYFPRLRYVALANPPTVAVDWREDYGTNSTLWRWWRILRNEHGQAIEVTEIPHWEGARVREYVRDANYRALMVRMPVTL